MNYKYLKGITLFFSSKLIILSYIQILPPSPISFTPSSALKLSIIAFSGFVVF